MVDNLGFAVVGGCSACNVEAVAAGVTLNVTSVSSVSVFVSDTGKSFVPVTVVSVASFFGDNATFRVSA